jgi:D-ribose pyranase
MNIQTKILNPELAAAITAARHGDKIVVGDPGLPIPPGVPVVHLGLVAGVPTFGQTCKAIIDELKVESILVAAEMKIASKAALQDLTVAIKGLKGPGEKPLKLQFKSHVDLKKSTEGARLIVVTGDCSPYTNAVFFAGVDFPR